MPLAAVGGSAFLVVANLALGLLVAVPLILVLGAGARALLRRRDRRVRRVLVPGIGEIPVLRD
jgi:hypothetical protein